MTLTERQRGRIAWRVRRSFFEWRGNTPSDPEGKRLIRYITRLAERLLRASERRQKEYITRATERALLTQLSERVLLMNDEVMTLRSTLNATRARCDELLEENRRLRRGVSAD